MASAISMIFEGLAHGNAEAAADVALLSGMIIGIAIAVVSITGNDLSPAGLIDIGPNLVPVYRPAAVEGSDDDPVVD